MNATLTLQGSYRTTGTYEGMDESPFTGVTVDRVNITSALTLRLRRHPMGERFSRGDRVDVTIYPDGGTRIERAREEQPRSDDGGEPCDELLSEVLDASGDDEPWFCE